ncbi:MAG: orotidine 5'-phosphate decarboxylase [Candidatus Magasanikbacteria bacterium RIFCSPHIGHO2_01_FULL_33_34]|uniref:Orotidine 5'-phosphate decarboxylase n=1 Tax=Candidatus Magasanikbacteria bacterium RIFCSPHIGHO2_01_FULL_33_34 TaxID=1798671 RepID=A0A1F6LJC0_9BACT|nr:MAG: orotidine 5'-phosphate decarboxylase [Candidatus Magasanikbacteria bacterium RIFCSPHIGHO2_01_FULL_33_34]OGH65509.1 MAG: orotidine 5'-phosphate decarboxylase [Candidatus Magasanikbacteria bacterium RIFCSPHIGHO2_02_FULL_33_17]OGH76219.1 MAG: orotidine 5'-phosphate decarboxylase [Candidatus Magasanikbacteria bacterium RIFCSPLOWO2_01_FULL_33_34]
MLTYSKRIAYTTNPTAQKLFEIIEEKKTNLCLSIDVTTKSELLLFADLIGPQICLLKTHIDIIEDFDFETISQLQRLSEKHNFLLFEDRKFADIGNTVAYQYQDGIYHIADWAHITNAHCIAGPGTIEGLKINGMHKGRGLLLIAQMSSKDNLTTKEYTQNTIELAKNNQDFVIGFISMKKLDDNPGFIHMTPGVKLDTGSDNLGQQYNTPESVIYENESDIIIVGRGIIESTNPKQEAENYKIAGWNAYTRRLEK